MADLDPGQEALVVIREHEKQCTERMAEIRRALGTLSTRLWWLMGIGLTAAGMLAFEFLKNT